MKPCWLYAVFKCHNQALFSSTQLAKHLSPILIQVLSVSLYIACMFVYIRQTSFVCSCSIKSEEIPSPLMRSSRILFFKIFLRRTRSLSRLHLSTCLRLFCFQRKKLQRGKGICTQASICGSFILMPNIIHAKSWLKVTLQ